jgi:hypothetical protein
MTDADLTPAVEVAPEKPARKKSAKAASTSANDGVRDWKDVVPQIQRMKDEGSSVPDIAEALQLSYVLVNQVMLQSYKMTVDTIGLFDRQERARLGLD